MTDKPKTIDFRKELSSREVLEQRLDVYDLAKTPEIIRKIVTEAIQDVKKIFQENQVNLGIDLDKVINPKVYVSKSIKRSGFFGGNFIFKIEEDKSLSKLTVYHEAVHFLVNQGWKEIVDGNNSKIRMAQGYSIWLRSYENEEVTSDSCLFQGFDEGTTDLIARILVYGKDILSSKKELIQSSGNGIYNDDVGLVYNILITISETTNANSKDGAIFESFKILLKSISSRDATFMHLIKSIYGKGAIKLLSEFKTEENIQDMKVSDKEKDEMMKRRRLILEFFSTNDISRREELKSKLLNNKTDAKQ